ncbi:hypothetical protein GLW00_11260 [Halobacillus litoralis]|uniref:Uncharacterized protein n=1 Tax=Halobacillus litoralis TaxID=45668 RepID=A0A845FCZ6_9BACI|nr:hypothetical protein [Halobacillus litoralis]MYL71437.1 hypothetical protein [Halobacillus litoralis]
MEELLNSVGWPVLLGFVMIHILLLLFKRRKVVLFISQVMAGAGALLMVIGLIEHLLLGVYGAIVLLSGIVFHFMTKDQMESR